MSSATTLRVLRCHAGGVLAAALEIVSHRVRAAAGRRSDRRRASRRTPRCGGPGSRAAWRSSRIDSYQATARSKSLDPNDGGAVLPPRPTSRCGPFAAPAAGIFTVLRDAVVRTPPVRCAVPARNGTAAPWVKDSSRAAHPIHPGDAVSGPMLAAAGRCTRQARNRVLPPMVPGWLRCPGSEPRHRWPGRSRRRPR